MPVAKPAAKPAAKPVAKPQITPEVITPEDVGNLDDVLNEPETPALKSGDTFKVKNTGKHILCLTKGSIEAGNTGLATVAEYSTLSQYMEKV